MTKVAERACTVIIVVVRLVVTIPIAVVAMMGMEVIGIVEVHRSMEDIYLKQKAGSCTSLTQQSGLPPDDVITGFSAIINAQPS